MTTRTGRLDRLRAALVPASHDPLARELQQFRSPRDLAELAALLDRHTDAEADPLREIVDLTRAA